MSFHLISFDSKKHIGSLMKPVDSINPWLITKHLASTAFASLCIRQHLNRSERGFCWPNFLIFFCNFETCSRWDASLHNARQEIASEFQYRQITKPERRWQTSLILTTQNDESLNGSCFANQKSCQIFCQQKSKILFSSADSQFQVESFKWQVC